MPRQRFRPFSLRGHTDLYSVVLIWGHLFIAAIIALVVVLTGDHRATLLAAFFGAAALTWRVLAGWAQGLCGERVRRDGEEFNPVVGIFIAFCGQFIIIVAAANIPHIVPASPSFEVGTPHFDALMSCVLLGAGITFGEFGSLYGLLMAYASRYHLRQEQNGLNIVLALLAALSAQVSMIGLLVAVGALQISPQFAILWPRGPSQSWFFLMLGSALLFAVAEACALSLLWRPFSYFTHRDDV